MEIGNWRVKERGDRERNGVKLPEGEKGKRDEEEELGSGGQ